MINRYYFSTIIIITITIGRIRFTINRIFKLFIIAVLTNDTFFFFFFFFFFFYFIFFISGGYRPYFQPPQGYGNIEVVMSQHFSMLSPMRILSLLDGLTECSALALLTCILFLRIFKYAFSWTASPVPNFSLKWGK